MKTLAFQGNTNEYIYAPLKLDCLGVISASEDYHIQSFVGAFRHHDSEDDDFQTFIMKRPKVTTLLRFKTDNLK